MPDGGQANAPAPATTPGSRAIVSTRSMVPLRGSIPPTESTYEPNRRRHGSPAPERAAAAKRDASTPLPITSATRPHPLRTSAATAADTPASEGASASASPSSRKGPDDPGTDGLPVNVLVGAGTVAVDEIAARATALADHPSGHDHP